MSLTDDIELEFLFRKHNLDPTVNPVGLSEDNKKAVKRFGKLFDDLTEEEKSELSGLWNNNEKYLEPYLHHLR